MFYASLICQVYYFILAPPHVPAIYIYIYISVCVYQNALHLTDSMVLDAQLPNDYSSRPPWMFPHSMTHIYGMDATEPSSAKERGQEEIEVFQKQNH